MNYTPLYYFMNENISLLEIKRTDQPEDAPKDEVYHWLAFDNQSQEIRRLSFKSMDKEPIDGNEINIRIFENAELRFTNEFAKFIENDQVHLVLNNSVDEIPDELKIVVEEFLSI